MLNRLWDIASSEFGIAHVTIQLDGSMDGCVEDHHIEHMAIYYSGLRLGDQAKRILIRLVSV